MSKSSTYEDFSAKVKAINQRCGGSSNPSDYWDQPEYQEIIADGAAFLPFIIDNLKKGLGEYKRGECLGPVWGKALREITGHTPSEDVFTKRWTTREWGMYWIGWFAGNNSDPIADAKSCQYPEPPPLKITDKPMKLRGF